MRKRVLSILLSLAMVLTMIPFATMTAFAGEETSVKLKVVCDGKMGVVETKIFSPTGDITSTITTPDAWGNTLQICKISSILTITQSNDTITIVTNDSYQYICQAKANNGYTFDSWNIQGNYNSGEETIISPVFKEGKGSSCQCKKLVKRAVITAAVVGTIYTVKAIRNYKAKIRNYYRKNK